jgi:hypothetical protein
MQLYGDFQDKVQVQAVHAGRSEASESPNHASDPGLLTEVPRAEGCHVSITLIQYSYLNTLTGIQDTADDEQPCLAVLTPGDQRRRPHHLCDRSEIVVRLAILLPERDHLVLLPQEVFVRLEALDA